MANRPHRIVLIGGGHAHVAVLADWIKYGLPCKQATLLTPSPRLRYSGMVPGWISGQYDRDAGLVDLAALAETARVDLVLDRCIGIDTQPNVAKTDAGREIAFDLASIDTGGVGRAGEIIGDDLRLIDVRPIDRFVDRLGGAGDTSRIAVVGGGAGGVEIAFGLRNRASGGAQPEVILVAGKDGLLPGFGAAVRRNVSDELSRQAIELVERDARIVNGALTAGEFSLEPLDLIVAALGSGAPVWPRESGLACDDDGFIAVDRYQRSISHLRIFAAGDVAARQDCVVPHSGVHAVHSGPILAANLRALAKGREPRESYVPRLRSLYLLSSGQGKAIASYGGFAAKGRWVAKLKHWIDTRWIDKYARLSGEV